MKRLSLALVAVPLLFAAEAEAQGDWWWGVTYNVSVPSGNTKEFIDNTSWRGASLEARKVLGDNASWGLLFGWYVFDQIQVDSLSRPGIDITGKPFKYVNAFPVQLTGHYYLGERRGTRFFLGGGAGLVFYQERVDVGLFRIEQNKTLFGIAPEIGVAIPLNWSLRGVLNVRYNYTTSSGDVPSQSWWGFGVGLAWN